MCNQAPSRHVAVLLGSRELGGIPHQFVPVPIRVRHRRALISKEFLVVKEHERGRVHRQRVERAVSPVLIEDSWEEFPIKFRLPAPLKRSKGSKSPFSPHHRASSGHTVTRSASSSSRVSATEISLAARSASISSSVLGPSSGPLHMVGRSSLQTAVPASIRRASARTRCPHLPQVLPGPVRTYLQHPEAHVFTIRQVEKHRSRECRHLNLRVLRRARRCKWIP